MAAILSRGERGGRDAVGVEDTGEVEVHIW